MGCFQIVPEIGVQREILGGDILELEIEIGHGWLVGKHASALQGIYIRLTLAWQ